MSTIAERIKKGMELKGMTQADLSRASGIPRSALSSYLSGKYAPKQDNIFRISKALNVSEAWLMGADVPMMRYPVTDEERAESDEIVEYLELLHKDPRYKVLLSSSSKLDVEALDKLVEFIKMLAPDE